MPRLSDHERARIETERRKVLRVLYASSEVGSNQDLIFNMLQIDRYPVTRSEIRRYLDYLEQKGLIKIEDRERDVWHATITAKGVDVIEGAVPVPPGVARG